MQSQLRNLTIRRENEAKEADQMVLKFKELSAKRETEAKEAQDVALKLKELSELMHFLDRRGTLWPSSPSPWM